MRLIVVEDKIPLNNSLTKILRQQNYAVDQAFDGQEALSLISEDFYDLIILDLTLPKIDGLIVLEKLRARHINAPILVLTARSQTPEIVTGLQIGADDYLSKPFEISELLARIQALIRRHNQQSQALLTCADLAINPETFEVWRANTLISLSKTEFALLHYLLLKQKWIVTKSELLTHVWQNDGAVFDRIVDTYICFLRKKIDRNFPDSPALIHTIKTRGYHLGVQNA